MRGGDEPPLILRNYKGAERFHELALKDPVTGAVLATFKYSPDKPLSCGARVWLEYDSADLLVEPM